jgi:hypothetical protein
MIVGNHAWIRGKGSWPKMNDIKGVIRKRPMRATFCCAWLMFASVPSDAMARSHHTGAELAYLSRPERETPKPAEETPAAMPQDNTKSFDGAWTFTSSGCPYTGSLPARIVGGKIIVRGGSGQVDPDGTLHSVGAGNGMTLTAVGQLSGNTGSGTFNRSDGCIGQWIAIKRENLRGRRR